MAENHRNHENDELGRLDASDAKDRKILLTVLLINLTQSMGLELGKQGILCNAIAPGTIATAGTAGLWVRPNPPPLPRPHPSRAQRFDVATLVCFRRVR